MMKQETTPQAPDENELKTKDEASAHYQVSKPDFCGVDTKLHDAFCAGWDAALANREATPSQLPSLDWLTENVKDIAESFCQTEAEREHRYLMHYATREIFNRLAEWLANQKRIAELARVNGQ